MGRVRRRPPREDLLLTPRGRRQFEEEESGWQVFTTAVNEVLPAAHGRDRRLPLPMSYPTRAGWRTLNRAISQSA